MIWAIVAGVLAIAIGAVIWTIKSLVRKNRQQAQEIVGLKASIEALTIELGQAQSRLEINQHVENKTADELAQSLGAGDPAAGAGPIGSLRRPAAAEADQSLQRRPSDPAVKG